MRVPGPGDMVLCDNIVATMTRRRPQMTWRLAAEDMDCPIGGPEMLHGAMEGAEMQKTGTEENTDLSGKASDTKDIHDA